MQVVNKKMCVVVILILVIIEACTLFLMYKSYSNQENILDEVNLNKEINSNMARYGSEVIRVNSTKVTVYDAWEIYSEGGIYEMLVSELHSVRLVFYLTNDISMAGKGTIDKPYIIK